MHDTVIIKKALLTEKSTHLMNENGTYTFIVDGRACKDEIKSAVERLYKVRVESVRTITRKGHRRRMRHGWVQAGAHKKAMVRLHEKDAIELF